MKSIRHIFIFMILLLLCANTVYAANGVTAFSGVGNFSYENGKYISDDSQLFSDGLLAVKVNDEFGYIDPKGNIVIPFSYQKADSFKNGIACVEQNEKKLVINKKGSILCDLSHFDEIQNAGNGLVIVKANGKYGFVTNRGAEKIKTVWDSVSAPSEGYIAVSLDGQFGYIDTNGNIVISPQYTYAGDFSNGAAYVEASRGMLINAVGEIIAKDVFSSVKDDLAIVQKDGLWGFVDSKGETVVPCEWDDVMESSEGLIGICKDDLWGYADYSGTVVIEPEWEFAWKFSNDMAMISEMESGATTSNKYGFINKMGFVTIDMQYKSALPFSDGYAAFLDEKTNKWGYLNPEGAIEIDAKYDYASSFSDGFAVVGMNSKFGIIDKFGLLLKLYDPNSSVSINDSSFGEFDIAPEEKEPTAAIDVSLIIALIIAIAVIIFLFASLIMQSIHNRKKRRRKKVEPSSNTLHPYDKLEYDDNMFDSVLDLNKKTKHNDIDYDDFDIGEYYDDLRGKKK